MAVQEIGFPLRLGEWTLACPTRRLAVQRMGVLDRGGGSDLEFREPPPGSPGAFVVCPVRAPRGRFGWSHGRLRWVIRRGPRYFIRLEGSYEDYLARFSGKTRSGLRRKARKLARAVDGAVDVRAYGRGDFSSFHEAAAAISRRSYQCIMFDAGLPEDAGSIRALEAAMNRGEAQGFVLFAAGEPLAYLYCPCADGVYEYQYVGYRPEHAGLSPGTVLLLAVLERLFADPRALAFDFTEGAGEASHKAFYATDSVTFETVAYLRPTPGNLTLIAARESVDGVSAVAGSVLKRLGAKEALRAWMRRRKGVAARA
ncbi:GNAT family N-acetyltransferase [Arhodomonas sp. SL1]|uniref:GNAT family N-acetyltransferase n=1 Tax=Arhodomonas sp. SL1 TaxID=3425691 RepID=UPI003F885E19